MIEQHLTEVADQVPDPQRDFAFSGLMTGDGMHYRETVTGRYGATAFTGWALESGCDHAAFSWPGFVDVAHA